MLKVFKFNVSNFIYKKEDKGYADRLKELHSPEYIEDTINDFLADKELVSMTTNAVDVSYHNNGYNNTVEMYYNIIYKEVK